MQYHPKANPGPTDSHYLFAAFTRLMDGREDYLDIDIAQDRLSGWRMSRENSSPDSFSVGREVNYAETH